MRSVMAGGIELRRSEEERMRTILVVAAGAMALAACATPRMTAMNAGLVQPQADARMRDKEPPVPPALRRPPQTLKGWAAPGSGGMY